MDIGILSENRPGEKRVILRPDELKEIASGHRVFVEKGAGLGIGVEDAGYEKAGAKIAGAKEVLGCALVVRLKEPKEEELAAMKPGSVIMSMLHLPGNSALRDLLKKYGLNAIAMDEIRDPLGSRMIEALHEAGYSGMRKGFELWGGDPEKCVVKIMGYGNVACGAIQYAARKSARVMILNKKDFRNMREHIPGTDILVNGINWPQELRGREFIITRDMLKLFKKGAVMADLVSNPPGQSPIETMHPTTLEDIAYEVDGVIHASCWSWPGLDPVNVSRRYSLQTAPIIKAIADNGIDRMPAYIKAALFRSRESAERED
jgi:alanine dehydrogenase